MGGNLVDVRDILAVDDTDEKTSNTALISLNSRTTHSLFKPGSLYIIPREWIKCIAVRKNKFILVSFYFCCRQVLRRSDTTVVRCQSFTLDEKYCVDETYFHVGCGPCNKQLQHIIAVCSVYTGLRNLMSTLLLGEFVNPAQMIYALGQYEDDLVYKTKNMPLHYNGNELRKYLEHILVCNYCYKYLYPFFKLLELSII